MWSSDPSPKCFHHSVSHSGVANTLADASASRAQSPTGTSSSRSNMVRVMGASVASASDMLTRVPVISLSVLLAGVAACGEEERTAPPTPPSADATRDCATHIEGRLPPADPSEDFYAGPVRFPRLLTPPVASPAARAGAYFRRRNGEYGGLKFVTEVRANTDVTVAIAPANRKTAGMLYGLDEIDYGRFGIPFDEGEQVVRFKSCPADKRSFAPRFYRRRTVGPWTQFNGGFILTRPQCVRLDVYVRGRPARRYAAPFGYPSRSSSASSCRRSSSGRSSPKRA